jgi:transposase-like protein
MFHHPRIESSTGMRIYFADPHSPWQRGTNENTNGLLRQYFPKSADLAVYTVEHIHDVAAELNDRPASASVTSVRTRPCDDQDTNSASCPFATFARDCRVYPVVFIDALMVKIRDGVVANRPVYLAIGVDCDGAKQMLGMWVGASTGESAKFWLSVLSELNSRAVADVCIVCCDGLTGLPDAISVTWPRAVVQTSSVDIAVGGTVPLVTCTAATT